MARQHDPLRACPFCGSENRRETDRVRVPGGIDWRHYECADCGSEWRV